MYQITVFYEVDEIPLFKQDISVISVLALMNTCVFCFKPYSNTPPFKEVSLPNTQ